MGIKSAAPAAGRAVWLLAMVHCGSTRAMHMVMRMRICICICMRMQC